MGNRLHSAAVPTCMVLETEDYVPGGQVTRWILYHIYALAPCMCAWLQCRAMNHPIHVSFDAIFLKKYIARTGFVSFNVIPSASVRRYVLVGAAVPVARTARNEWRLNPRSQTVTPGCYTCKLLLTLELWGSTSIRFPHDRGRRRQGCACCSTTRHQGCPP
jgi:hypothetical protein